MISKDEALTKLDEKDKKDLSKLNEEIEKELSKYDGQQITICVSGVKQKVISSIVEALKKGGWKTQIDHGVDQRDYGPWLKIS